MTTYLVCGCKPWNRDSYHQLCAREPGDWHFVSTRDELVRLDLEALQPRFIFFLHWSWRVPREITERWECVNFHLTDLPFGRGGSPLQNLIVRGYSQTRLSALRMVEDLDAGPIYLQRPLELCGNAEEILVRGSDLAVDMISDIIRTSPEPVPQEGPVEVFQRRTPAQSELPITLDLDAAFDFIRMLDGHGYPPAFLERGQITIEFSQAVRYNDRIEAHVTLRAKEELE